jgi:hypothetical protein
MVAHSEHATTAESELECAAVTVEFDARGPIEDIDRVQGFYRLESRRSLTGQSGAG